MDDKKLDEFAKEFGEICVKAYQRGHSEGFADACEMVIDMLQKLKASADEVAENRADGFVHSILEQE